MKYKSLKIFFLAILIFSMPACAFFDEAWGTFPERILAESPAGRLVLLLKEHFKTSPDASPLEPAPEPLIVVVPNEGETSSGEALQLKPVRFRNLGRLPYTVMPATYTLPDGSPGIPANTSTVAFPGGNPSSHLSLPLGTYTWCYYWELGDTNGDSITDYAYAIPPSPLELNANASDDIDLAISVDLAAPSGSGEKPGPCAPVELPTTQPPVAPAPEITMVSSLPLEPITYQADIGGVPLVLTVDFQTGSVTGTFSLAGEDYFSTEVSGGFLSANRLVTATYAGIAGATWLGKEWATYGTIEGTISEDFSSLSGVVVNAEGESFDFTAVP